MGKIVRRLLVALIVLLMPLGMVPAAAAHDAAATSMAMAMPMQHCPDEGQKHGTNGASAECTMVCSSALPAADRVQQEPIAFHEPQTAPADAVVLHGLHPDIATPPPKRA
jgi:hypothetical protein